MVKTQPSRKTNEPEDEETETLLTEAQRQQLFEAVKSAITRTS
jgi:hypothetical protein